MKKRIIKLFGKITEETVNNIGEQVIEILEENETSGINPIYILINSMSEDFATEEDCYAGIAIRNWLKLLPNKLIGAVIAFSDEATNIIFMDCDKKFACPDATFLFSRNLDFCSESFKRLRNHDDILDYINDDLCYTCKKNEIFEIGLADYRLTSFDQLFEEDKK